LSATRVANLSSYVVRTYPIAMFYSEEPVLAVLNKISQSILAPWKLINVRNDQLALEPFVVIT